MFTFKSNWFSMTRIIICLLLSFSFLSITVAQDKEQKSMPDSGLVVLSVNSGEQFVGTIISEDARELSIRLQNGKMLIIPSYTVKSIRKLSTYTLVKGKPVFANPHPSRYFYTPSAIPMDKGEVYIQTLYAVAYQVQFGVTENFSVGATTTIIGTPLALTAKYSIKIDEKNTLAFGGLAGIVGWGTRTNLGIGFGAFTHGTKESNITIAGGYAWINERNNGGGNSPVMSLSGNQRLSKNLSLMGELWYLPEVGVFFGGPCFRLYNNKKSSFDLGIWSIIAPNSGGIPLIPVVGYTFKFEK
jgi:hypothetical protein